MKIRSLFIIAALVSSIGGASAQKNTDKKGKMELKSKNDQIGYSLGVIIGSNLKKQGFDSLNYELLSKGLRDVYEKNPLIISADSANKMLSEYSQAQQRAKVDQNINEGIKFFETNGKRKEVVTLASGLQYEVIKAGEGPKPIMTDKITAHYRGTFLDGNVFDSSIDRGQPATFPVNGVIQGWIEALLLMNTGSEWKLYIPYNLAYGEKGAPPNIPPYATLIFDINLLSIEKP
jgi:FKBP-type peptidyl-prolyl cis-trans isomerase FklB